MPIISSYYQRRFSWQTDDSGLPIGEAVNLAGHLWLITCPRCSCWHEIKSAGVIEPACLLPEIANGRHKFGAPAHWKTIYDAWIAQHPEALDTTQIRVQVVGFEELAARSAIPVKKPAAKLVEKPKRQRKAKAA